MPATAARHQENPAHPIASSSGYFALLKPRVMSLVMFTALTGVLIAPSHVNPVMGMAARRWAVERLGEVSGALVWDLYGGIGDTAVWLAAGGASVVSVDADETAVSWARRRPDVAGYGDRLRFIAARAEDVLSSLAEPQAVVVNPPRAGLHWDVTLRLTGHPVPRVAYVSSDPATLARDLQRLAVNYQVRAVRAFDLSPQTAHVETVVYLEGA